ncbi:MAG: hypothetical protein MMC33_002837 [Icmadophila ericetorum]|nr:hypothetical protein [Icmadophila ericetorum]
MAEEQPKDHWTTKAYTASASFVPELTSTIVSWLDPQTTDTILDLGCGDGVLTHKISKRCSAITGLDASPNLVDTAQTAYGSSSDLIWHVTDVRYLETSPLLQKEHYDKVFSNAALHWILRDPGMRLSVLRAAYHTLKPGGAFVFEMGGAGNVPEVHAALLAALVHQGLSIQEAREACPWFFPSVQLMSSLLKGVGFEIEKSQLEYRPTKLTSDQGGGIEGWVYLMGAQLLEKLPQEKRATAVREICDVLETILTHEEDGSKWMGYVRLRFLARKK